MVKSGLTALALTKSNLGAIVAQMWPMMSGGAFNTIPDCRNGGHHRFGAPHFDKSRSEFVQACRICPAVRWINFKEKAGKMMESPIISTPTPTDQRSDLI